MSPGPEDKDDADFTSICHSYETPVIAANFSLVSALVQCHQKKIVFLLVAGCNFLGANRLVHCCAV